MRFIIEDNEIKETRNGYLLIVETMRGDADGYNDIEVGTFGEHDIDLLKEVIEVCDNMLDAYPRGRGGYDTYNHIKGFERWFDDEYEKDSEDICKIAPFHWTYDEDCQDSIYGYTLFYLKDGKRYNVKIVKEEE